MNANIIKKQRLIVALLALVLVGIAALAYFGTQRVYGYGKWAILKPNAITLIDDEGDFDTNGGDYRMSSNRIVAFENWLESNGFARDQGQNINTDEAYFRGSYKGSLPVAVKIESRLTPEAAQIGLLYEGHFFKWRYQKRKKLVQRFSNEIAKQCKNGKCIP